jgi:quercetin dioxygenase-like cupin family protein
MAVKNKVLINRITGQDIKFLQTSKDTGGKLLEIESIYHSFSKEPPPHYHPHQEEDFEVLKGEISVRVNGKLRVLKQGEHLHIPANQIHSMWNNTHNITVVNWKVQPALDSEYFLETAIGLVNDGKTNNAGIPNILQVALMVNKFSHVFRLANPPYAIQKILFLALTPFAYIFGFRPSYPKYFD